MAKKTKPQADPVPEPETEHKMGYARVSTSDQDLRMQRDALIAAGVDPRDIFEEKKSGADAKNRPEFQAMLKDIRRGDTIYVWKLDRLARSVLDLYETAKFIEEKGARLVVLTMPGMDTSTSTGKLIFGVLAAVADFERALTVERTQGGLQAARKAGRFGGRKSDHTDAAVLALQGVSKAEGARRLKMSQAGFTKRLQAALRRQAEGKTDSE